MGDILVLDGSHGEGGGQIVRTALSLSAITGRPIHITNIRSNRRNPGLQPQHLSAVRAIAAISEGLVSGDQIGSTELILTPRSPARPGRYRFDVEEIAERGSAGCVNLVLQTLLVPLALASGPTTLTLRGGTHVESAPSFDDLVNSYFPALRRMGFSIEAELTLWGWYPIGHGEVVCEIAAAPSCDGGTAWPGAIEAVQRGRLRGISGRAVAANLPAHIAQRMASRASASLAQFGVPVDIQAQCVSAACAGAGIFILADYEGLAASFSAYGRRGKPAEAVADEAVEALLAHQASGAAVEPHLADQLLLPLAVAGSPSVFALAQPTRHLMTNAWVIRQFGIADIVVEEGAPCLVRVQPCRELQPWRTRPSTSR
jgi:RNA 3'-terminal phosphate cyclase (ATP)